MKDKLNNEEKLGENLLTAISAIKKSGWKDSKDFITFVENHGGVDLANYQHQWKSGNLRLATACIAYNRPDLLKILVEQFNAKITIKEFSEILSTKRIEGNRLKFFAIAEEQITDNVRNIKNLNDKALDHVALFEDFVFRNLSTQNSKSQEILPQNQFRQNIANCLIDTKKIYEKTEEQNGQAFHEAFLNRLESVKIKSSTNIQIGKEAKQYWNQAISKINTQQTEDQNTMRQRPKSSSRDKETNTTTHHSQYTRGPISFVQEWFATASRSLDISSPKGK